MATRAPDISLRRQARQARARATVDAVLEAAAYVLEREGVGAFTTNRVAEKAGVNIASLYQYFPNKAALLFQLAQVTWERQLARLTPLLSASGVDGAERLRRFVVEFFRIEAEEAELRRALHAAAVDLRDTPEFAALIKRGSDLTRDFLRKEAGGVSAEEREAVVDFMVGLITSFAERATDLQTPAGTLDRQAGWLSDMLIARFGIGSSNTN